MSPAYKLITEEFRHPYGCSESFKGRLLSASPSRSKPRNMEAAEWCAALMKIAFSKENCRVAIPESFWAFNQGSIDLRETTLPAHIAVPDLPSTIGIDQTETPCYAIEEIVQSLKRGEDVLVLSATTGISGFIPAVLTRLTHPNCHLVKLFYPIESAGYALSPDQKGYIAGLSDAQWLSELDLPHEFFVERGSEGDHEQKVPSDSIDQGLLEKQNHLIRLHLETIGHELIDEITLELMGLTDFMDECERAPEIDVTIGAFASIGYRLCDVFKATGQMGFDAIRVSKPVANDEPPQSLTEQVAKGQAQLGLIADRIAQLYSSHLCFLPCDINVLKGHPEVSQNQALVDALKLICDQFGEIQGRLDEISSYALQQSQLDHLNGLTISFEKKGRAWEAMRAMLENCLHAALQKCDEERVQRVKGPISHPKQNDVGKTVQIKQPTQPSSSIAWGNSNATAIFIPDGKSPSTINGIPVSRWSGRPKSACEWNTLDLLMPDLKEPALPKSSLPTASGVVTIEPDGRIWMVSPTNQFGGYENTFPKGKRDDSKLTLQANAVKEAYEESGLKVRITGYLGDFKRTTSITRLYIAERVGGDPTQMGWESQAVKLVPEMDWAAFLKNPSDQPVLKALQQHLAGGA